VEIRETIPDSHRATHPRVHRWANTARVFRDAHDNNKLRTLTTTHTQTHIHTHMYIKRNAYFYFYSAVDYIRGVARRVCVVRVRVNTVGDVIYVYDQRAFKLRLSCYRGKNVTGHKYRFRRKSVEPRAAWPVTRRYASVHVAIVVTRSSLLDDNNDRFSRRPTTYFITFGKVNRREHETTFRARVVNKAINYYYY